MTLEVIKEYEKLIYELRSLFPKARIVFLRGGVHPDYFVKLDFEIAVDQQTRARDRTFEGVSDSG